MAVVRRRKLQDLVSRCLDASAGRGSFVLDDVGCISAGLENEVDPVERGGRVLIWYANPLSWLRVFGALIRAPGDVGGN